jgi:hypothetical protein
MKRWFPVLIPVGAFALVMLACSLPVSQDVKTTAEFVSTSAAQTVQRMQTEAGTPVLTLMKMRVTLNRANMPRLGTKAPDGQTGSITGAIRHSGLPDAMRIYWRELATGKVGYIEVTKSDTTYTIGGLAAGDYNVISWYWPQGASGAVTTTNIVTAKGAAEQQTCKSSVRAIHVDPGQAVAGADIGCWGGDFFFLVTPTAP